MIASVASPKMDYKEQTVVLSAFVLVGMMFLVPPTTEKALGVIHATAIGTCFVPPSSFTGPHPTHPCWFSLKDKHLDMCWGGTKPCGKWTSEPAQSGTRVTWSTAGNPSPGDEKGSVTYKVDDRETAVLSFDNPVIGNNKCSVSGMEGSCTAGKGYSADFTYVLRGAPLEKKPASSNEAATEKTIPNIASSNEAGRTFSERASILTIKMDPSYPRCYYGAIIGCSDVDVGKERGVVELTISGHLWGHKPGPGGVGWVLGYVPGATIDLTGLPNSMSVQTDSSGNYLKETIVQGKTDGYKLTVTARYAGDSNHEASSATTSIDITGLNAWARAHGSGD